MIYIHFLMADQGNNGQHTVPNQSQAFASMAQPALGMAQVAMSSEQAATGRSGDGLGALAPIFPPQNFEVPDISFSNSVSPNADFNRSLFSAVQMFTASAGSQYADALPSAPGPAGVQQQGAYFPPPSSSPPGTSSSDDSDDLPLAHLAKRTIGGTGVGSPSGLTTDATSLENSPLSGTKKPKAAKKKKKKDPNEPQKPVSAYALFFRDTQATIKGHNPNASFGEVSKIVASMWDQLDPEHKDVYKKKTETAKKQYLKQLAAYRASQVSQSAADETESSPSPPSVMSSMTSVANTVPQGLHSGAVSQQAAHIPTTMSGQLLQQQMMPSHHQTQQLYPQMSAGQQVESSSLPQQQRYSPVQQQGSPPTQVYSSPPHGVGPAGPNSYRQPIMDNNMYGYTDPESEMELTYPSCVRSGCGNYAKENPSWDSEYCSNDCVISHCRDIFTKWVASRSDTNSYPVK